MEMQGEQMAAGSAGSLLLGEEGEDEGELTSEKLKAQLYLSLQSKGVLSQLKSQLRCRLVQELRRGCGSATPPVPLALQVANGVVAEHLRGCGYQYTLSTFLPESNTHLDRLLSREDILHYLHLQPPASLHSLLTDDTGRGFLRDLLDSLATVSVGGATCDHTHSIGIQTEERDRGRGGVALTLAERLRALDEEHFAQLTEEGGGEEGERGEWRRECEEQLRKEMEGEMEQFRETELAKVREEERVHCEVELRNLRMEQEETHHKKMESLRRLELDTLNSLRARQLETEATLFSRRQELELQLQGVGMREEQLRRETEARQQALVLLEQRLSVAAEQLGAREREVMEYRERMEAVVRGEFAAWETRLETEQGRQDAVRVELDEARVAVKEERKRREGVEEALHQASRQLVELQRQREDSLRALEKVSDHGAIKQQLAEARTQLARAERRLSESRAEHRRLQTEQQEMIRGLRRQLGRPAGEQRREEGERARRELVAKLTEAEEEKKQLREELCRQAAVVGRQRSQLEEQALGLREMEREVRDLSAQLAHWQTSILHSRYTTISVGSRQAVTQTVIPTTPSPPHMSPPHLVSTLDQLEQETEQLQIHYQQLLHPPSLPTHTHSPPHTPTSCAVLSWPVGGASSMTTSVPLTVHTNSTKTTPTYQLPKTTPTSFPARTTPISVPNIPPKTTPTLPPNFPETTPTTSIALPQATPTTESAVPRLSLDQLWRQPSPPTTAVPLSSSSSLPTPSVSVSLPQPTTSLPKIVSSSRHPTTSLPSTPPASFPQPALASSPNSLSCADPSTLAPSTAAGFSLSPALPTTSVSPITTLSPTTAAYQTSLLSPALPTTSVSPTTFVSSVHPTTAFPIVSTSVSRRNVTATSPTPPSSVERAMETKEKEDVTSSAETKGGVDPLMMKYMELVTQKRAEEKREGRGQQPRQDISLSEHSQVQEVRSLSQATDSVGGFSDGDQSSRDPFQDW